jgi:hypothetical protein
MTLAYYKKFIKEAKEQGLFCDHFYSWENITDINILEDSFKSFFPQKIIDLIIHRDTSLAPLCINSGSTSLKFTATFVLKNPI